MNTLGNGAVWHIRQLPDPKQTWLLSAMVKTTKSAFQA